MADQTHEKWTAATKVLSAAGFTEDEVRALAKRFPTAYEGMNGFDFASFVLDLPDAKGIIAPKDATGHDAAAAAGRAMAAETKKQAELSTLAFK